MGVWLSSIKRLRRNVVHNNDVRKCSNLTDRNFDT